MRILNSYTKRGASVKVTFDADYQPVSIQLPNGVILWDGNEELSPNYAYAISRAIKMTRRISEAS